MAVFSGVLTHGRDEDAVLEGETAEGEGCEDVRGGGGGGGVGYGGAGGDGLEGGVIGGLGCG